MEAGIHESRLNPLEAVCRILPSLESLEADLAALVETRTGSARTQPAAGPDLELEEDGLKSFIF